MSPKRGGEGSPHTYLCTAAPLLRREMKWQFSVLKIHHRQCYSIENALQGLMLVGNFSTVHSAVDTKEFLVKRLCLMLSYLKTLNYVCQICILIEQKYFVILFQKYSCAIQMEPGQ